MTRKTVFLKVSLLAMMMVGMGVGNVHAADGADAGIASTSYVNAMVAPIVMALGQAQQDVKSNQDAIGTLSELNTTNKGSAVAAINETNGKIGDLTTLTTEKKGNVVEAVNEVIQVVSESMNEYSETMQQGFKDVSSVLGQTSDLTTTKKDTLVNAINEVNATAQAAKPTFAPSGTGNVVTSIGETGTYTMGTVQIPVGNATTPTGYAAIWVE